MGIQNTSVKLVVVLFFLKFCLTFQNRKVRYSHSVILACLFFSLPDISTYRSYPTTEICWILRATSTLAFRSCSSSRLYCFGAFFISCVLVLDLNKTDFLLSSAFSRQNHRMAFFSAFLLFSAPFTILFL